MGRDVESIVRDLADTAVNLLRQEQMQEVSSQAADRAEERILDALLPPPRTNDGTAEPAENSTRQMFRKKLRQGELDDKEIEIDLDQVAVGVEIMAPPGMEEMTSQLQNMFSSLGQVKKQEQRLSIKEARKRLQDEEAGRLINEEEIRGKAVDAVEQTGIVFIDELDKVAKRSETAGTDVSREGVQRDLLLLIEGCTVSTKYGAISTDHILFIGSGAFHLAKPSDLIPSCKVGCPFESSCKPDT